MSAYLEAIRAEERARRVAECRVVLRSLAREVLTACAIGDMFRRRVAIERLASRLIMPWPDTLRGHAYDLSRACDDARRGRITIDALADLARATEAL